MSDLFSSPHHYSEHIQIEPRPCALSNVPNGKTHAHQGYREHRPQLGISTITATLRTASGANKHNKHSNNPLNPSLTNQAINQIYNRFRARIVLLFRIGMQLSVSVFLQRGRLHSDGPWGMIQGSWQIIHG